MASSIGIAKALWELESILGRMEAEEEEGPPVLRTPCAPGEVTSHLSGIHVHRCPCGEKWKHRDSLSYSDSVTREQFREAHSCPACGNDVRDKYYGEGR